MAILIPGAIFPSQKKENATRLISAGLVCRKDIFKSIENLIKLIKTISWDNALKPAKIILVSLPPLIEAINKDKYRGCEEKAKALGQGYQNIALSKIDGAHLEPEAHQKIAKILTKTVKDLLKMTHDRGSNLVNEWV